MTRPDRTGERGQTSAEYMGVLLLVAVIVGAVLMLSGLDRSIVDGMRTAICRIAGGDCRPTGQAATPERCLESSTTTSSKASILIAVVKVDKDSTLIREDYSDGTSRFTILDNSEVAGELFAGVKGKIAKYGINYSASADAGLALAGARVFELPDQSSADDFQDKVQAAGGFDEILRDLASYNDEIPFVGWHNPLGGIDDWALDQLGVDDNQDLPVPTETYMEGKAFLKGNGEAGGGVGIDDAQLKALIEGAGVVKVTTAGADKGDVELSVELGGDLDGALTEATLGAGGSGKAKFTATITLDAQNGYAPDKLIVKGTAGYTGNLDMRAKLEGDELKDISSALKKVSLSSNAGEGQGLEFTAQLDLHDPENLAATLNLLASGANPAQQPQAIFDIAHRFDGDGTLSLDTFDTQASETEGEIKVGLGIGGGAGGKTSTESQTGRTGQVRPPGGSFQPRVCKQPSS